MSNLKRASALILYRLKPTLELFFVRRSEHMRAFPGQWTFPGGHFDDQDQASIPERYADLAQAADKQTALREPFEETGLWPFPVPKEVSYSKQKMLRQQLLDSELDWADVCRQLNFSPDLEMMISLGVRVSPPIIPKCFYTWYFLLEINKSLHLDEPHFELALSDELSYAGWFKPQDLLARWQQAEILIPAPVLGVLEALKDVERIQEQELVSLSALSNSQELLYPNIVLHPGIEMVPLKTPTIPPASHTNTYLVGDEQFVIIDPASPLQEEQKVLKDRIQRRLQVGAKPQGILLTHHHPDHIGAVECLRGWLKIPVYAHQATAERLKNKLNIDHCVPGGFIWDLGVDSHNGLPWQLKAVHTPGHAPGHLCFLDLRHRVAIVGDMLAGFGTVLIKRPRGNMQEYLDSLQKLIDLNLLRAFPAHGPMITKPSDYCRYYIQHRLEREQSILNVLEKNALSEDDLLKQVYHDVDPRVITMARWTLNAHIHKLLSEKRVLFSDQKYQIQ